MITLKLIGSLLFGISGVIMAISYSRFQIKKLTTIDGFMSLLFYIKGQIDCFARPRSDILASLPLEVFCACNCPKGAETLEEMVDASRIYLDEEPLRLVSSFASEFGSTFRDEQLRRCDYYISALGEERKRVFASVNSKSRAGSALWICVCIGIIILLW
jgi:hypothetical protein